VNWFALACMLYIAYLLVSHAHRMPHLGIAGLALCLVAQGYALGRLHANATFRREFNNLRRLYEHVYRGES
jgi:hypothetical protein